MFDRLVRVRICHSKFLTEIMRELAVAKALLSFCSSACSKTIRLVALGPNRSRQGLTIGPWSIVKY